MRFTAGCLGLLLGWSISISGLAQTITVDVTDGDLVDIDLALATVADLPGPDGHVSLTEAVVASNHTVGRQRIVFAIPESDWTYLPGIYPGRAVIHGMMNEATVTDSVILDGRTQTAFTGDTNPAGNEVVILRGGGLFVQANDCRIYGLDRTVIEIEGTANLVHGNSEMGITVRGGENNLIRRNTGGGHVTLIETSHNVVVGNILDRVRVVGWIAGGRPALNNRVGGPLTGERNVIRGSGVINSQGIPSGSAVQLFDSIGTVIENNWIGLATDGISQGHPNTTLGIILDDENHVIEIRNNRIAGILAIARPTFGPAYPVGTGIHVGGTGSDLKIQGNKLGLNALQQATRGSVDGIVIANDFRAPFRKILIGGTLATLRNEIAGQLQDAIVVGNQLPDVQITRNSLHHNGGLGIDLIDAGFLTGVSLNDPGDGDAGANDLQNFPELQSALLTPGGGAVPDTLRITGTLATRPSRSYMVEVFVSPEGDPSGHGEGQFFIGQARVTTDGTGVAAIDVTCSLAIRPQPGWVVTATATERTSGATSEFSQGIAIEVGD